MGTPLSKYGPQPFADLVARKEWPPLKTICREIGAGYAHAYSVMYGNRPPAPEFVTALCQWAKTDPSELFTPEALSGEYRRVMGRSVLTWNRVSS